MSRTDRMSGVIAPVLTPYNEDMSPDTDRFIEHCHWLLANGCCGLAVFGTTSEANSLSAREKMELLEAVIQSGVDPRKLMPGTGACSITETVALTAHAVQAGCGGVLMLPPFYYKGVDNDGLFRHFDEVIQRVADSELHIYLYHIPPQAVIGFDLDLIGRLMDAYPDTVVGLKDSSGSWDNMKGIMETYPNLTMFPGSEQFLLPALRMGAAGTISAQANVNAPALGHLFDNWESADAEALQDAVTALRGVFTGYPLIPFLKEIVAHFRRDPAWRNLRPPLSNLDSANAGALIDAVTRHGFSMPNLEALALTGE